MLGAFASEVLDLLTAGDAGGDHVEVAVGGLHFGLDRGEEPTGADGARQLVVLLLEAERPRHAAAARVDFFDLEARRQPQHGQRWPGADERLLVAMAVQ